MMINSTSSFDYYTDLHNDFSDSYQEINQEVINVYSKPKRFIEETGERLDRFLKEFSIPGAPIQRDLPTRSVLDFIKLVDEFTLFTVGLFNEHKTHVDECARYMKKVSNLKALQYYGNNGGCTSEYVDLIPELLNLHGGLKRIKDKSNEMLRRLEKLEMRWERIRTVINN